MAHYLRDRDEALRKLKCHLNKAQEHMRQTRNAYRREVNFDIGDWVDLKLHPHRKHSVAQRINQKLAPHYYGPFQIVEKFGPVTYKQQLSPSTKIHLVFHTSLLKRAATTQTIDAELLSVYTLDEVDCLLPNKVLAHRSILHHGNPVKQFLIQWQHKPVEEATWEEEWVMKTKFPTFSLEDKTAHDGLGSDRESLEGDRERKINIEPRQDIPTSQAFPRRERDTL